MSDLIDRQGAAELTVEALEHFREDTKNKQTNKQSDFADLVSRNLVLSEVKSGMIRTIDGEDWKRVSENVRGIRELPSAQPRPKGKWIPYSKVYENRNRCSECDYHLVGTPAHEANFCPNCGADMGGEADG